MGCTGGTGRAKEEGMRGSDHGSCDRTSDNTVLVTAYAKAPAGTAMYEAYKHAGIILEIDLNTNKIVDAEFTFVTNVAQNFFRRLVIGYDLSAGIEPLVKVIEARYLAPSAKSVVVALRAAYQRYIDVVRQTETG